MLAKIFTTINNNKNKDKILYDILHIIQYIIYIDLLPRECLPKSLHSQHKQQHKHREGENKQFQVTRNSPKQAESCEVN